MSEHCTVDAFMNTPWPTQPWAHQSPVLLTVYNTLPLVLHMYTYITLTVIAKPLNSSMLFSEKKNKYKSSVLCSVTTYADNVVLPDSPTATAAINISYWPGPQQQTCSGGFAAVYPCRERQRRTDSQTDGHIMLHIVCK